MPQPGTEEAGAEDMHAAEARLREAEYRHQKTRFLVALALTLPVAVLAMAGHLAPALADILNFTGRPWLELALTTPVLFWAGRRIFYRRLGRHPASRCRHEHPGSRGYAVRLPVQPGRHTVSPQWLAVGGGGMPDSRHGGSRGRLLRGGGDHRHPDPDGTAAGSPRPQQDERRHPRPDRPAAEDWPAWPATASSRTSPWRRCGGRHRAGAAGREGAGGRRGRRGHVDGRRKHADRRTAAGAKKVGDTVIGATLNKTGSFRFRATKVGKDTVLAADRAAGAGGPGQQGAHSAAGGS